MLSTSDDQDDQYINTYVKEIVVKRLISSCGVTLREQTAERSCTTTQAVRAPGEELDGGVLPPISMAHVCL